MRRLADLQERAATSTDASIEHEDIEAEARIKAQLAVEHLSSAIDALQAATLAQPMMLVRGRASYGDGARPKLGRLHDQARVLRHNVEKLLK